MLCCLSTSFVGYGLFASVILLVISHFTQRKKRSVEGKHVLVTGGSLGIGRSFAIEAAKRGAHVTLVARNVQNLEKAAEDVKKAAKNPDQKIQCISMDLSGKCEELKAKMKDAEDVNGPIYMLVNCAGSPICGKLEDLKDDDIKYVTNLNILGTILPTKAVITGMKERGDGIVIAVASQAASVGVYGYCAYSATKYAIRGFAESLRMETKPYGVSVTLAIPPDTDTPGLAEELKQKPEECKLVCEEAGFSTPDVVATKMMNDALKGKFLSTVGWEGALASIACAGFIPPSSGLELLWQFGSIGFLRLFAAYLVNKMDNIVADCKARREKQK
ncbi:3-ketodihydrosphingosine reductase [Neocloeon triangulifer]|uniref:3-ketodihydrosphingosine reductase n=1 Tax=Neocloeon triangulifer TaxID=2078957 RepID=UPI00286F91AE|nr:3-ketodihydrosphingosine reductase [Neocloeon triangulifer]